METDKELALWLVDKLEEYLRRYILLESILDEYEVPQWRQHYEELLPLPEAPEAAHKIFASTRAAILDAPDLTAAVRET